MTEDKEPEVKPDDLTKTKEPGAIELTEEELRRVSGGCKVLIRPTEEKI